MLFFDKTAKGGEGSYTAMCKKEGESWIISWWQDKVRVEIIVKKEDERLTILWSNKGKNYCTRTQKMVFEEDKNGWKVRVKDRPGVWAWGKTQDEAIAELIIKRHQLFGIKIERPTIHSTSDPHWLADF